MTEIRVPKLNTNDAEYVLVEWLAEHGAAVERDDPLVTIETSKAVEELAAETSGVVEHLLPAGAECRPGQAIGRLKDGTVTSMAEEAKESEPTGPIITAPAQALIDELGLDPALVRGLGVKVVKRSDVEHLSGAGEPVIDLTPHQRAVARTVTESHRTVPAAYSVVRIDVGAAVALARDLTRRHRKLIGLPDLTVAALAALHEKHPMFFATMVDERTARPAEEPHVGVTFDLGNGLYVPVVRDAARLTIEEISARLAEFRRSALHGRLRERDLAGGNIVLTLHHDGDIVLAIPIVFPGQACALALTAPRREPAFDEDGDVVARTVADVGLAFDHRLVGGRQAALFLQDLKELLESPERLTGPPAPGGR